MESTRIQTAITGIGVISPIGNDLDTILKNVLEKKDGIKTATKIDTSAFHSHLCGEFDFDFEEVLSQTELQTYKDPFLRLAISAARRAIDDSKFDILSNTKKIAIVVATCNAGMNSHQIEYRNLHGDFEDKFDRQSSLECEFYAVAKALSSALKTRGEVYVINTACSGSTAAIGFAQTLIESGEYDAVLAGGADAVSLANYAGFSAIKVVSDEKTAPFSTPIGMNIGEGGAFWLLENMDKAKSREAKIYAKIVAHSTTADAFHPTQPDPRGDGVFRTMASAMQYAQIPLEKIGCINAHASGTSANDKAEAKGVLKFLNGVKMPITSSKSYNGHCMGATGILEATLQLVSLLNGFIPPTLRFNEARTGCEELNVVSDILKSDYSAFLSSNYAFAGNNAAIVVAKKDAEFDEHKFENCKIAITGLGAICQLGKSSSEISEAIFNDKSYELKPVRFLENNPELPRAVLIEKLNTRQLDRRIDFSGMNEISTYATIAVKNALDSASIKVSRANSNDIALTSCVSRGSSEEAHMHGVFADSTHKGDITCFSNVTPNSTAGWVSKALEIKGANITLTSSPNSALQGISYAAKILQNSEAKVSISLCADEVYEQMLSGYEKIGNTLSSAQSQDFKIRLENKYNTLYSEGASALVLEKYEDALSRNAKIYGTITAISSSNSCDDFLGENLDESALLETINSALSKANLKASDIDLILLSPSGNSQDSKILKAKETLFKNTPAYTANLNTGFVETSSMALSICACLETLASGKNLKMRKWQIEDFDKLPLPQNPKKILAFASSHVGNNSAIIIER